MIRAIRPSAMAQDEASLVTGWNVSPNLAYVLRLLPGPASCGVFLFAADGTTLIATGAALAGTEQPCVLLPQTGQTIGMVDAELGWHLLITTTGTESQREIRIGPAVDLPDEIHPVYGDDDLGLARATAAIDGAAHYIDDVTVSCPLGLGAGLGDVVSVPVDGAAVAGQVESITWTATPDGASEQAVIRRNVAIAPEPAVAPPTPPAVADDTGETDAATTTIGNVLTNDTPGLAIVAVNGLSARVGQIVAGSNGGKFLIAANGAWTFDPDGDFASLAGSDTATTAVTYHASDGIAEAMGTLTVTVSSGTAVPWTPAEITTALWLDAADSGTITLTSGKVSQWADKSGNSRNVAQATASAQPVVTAAAQNSLDVLTFDGAAVLATSANFPETGNAEFSVFWVHTKTSSSGGCVFGWGNSGTSLQACGLYDDGSSRGIAYAGGNFCATGAISAGYNVWGYVKSAGAINSASDFRKNGANTVTAASSSTPNIASATLKIGQWSLVTSNRLVGSLAELIVLPSAADATTRQKIEGYLAHKWGLASLLPSDHPHKSTAPTV